MFKTQLTFGYAIASTSCDLFLKKSKKMGFEGKVILITGASSGIGAAAAMHFAELGANVAIVGRNAERLNDVADQIRNAGSPEPLPIVADVTECAERILNETIEHFGKLDVLVNNAGVFQLDSVAEIDLSEFDRVFSTNVRGVVALTKFCVPYLEKTKGNIVNVSSIIGLKPFPNALSYCMSKAAIDQFTKCCALDLASKGIRVNAINPALVRTALFLTSGLSSEANDAFTKDQEAKYPLGRVGDVSDTTSALTYLADNESASFITGTCLPVDGGALIA